ncbi:hypothetical protein B0H63DRAFT_31300 [Podospora didyma]|uniref:Zn(2)-C6 fungal-type domain-containing protein n=1 Tax=Podospora didyma TaxID=330526 RepID=A0AAE0P5V6_9PEZI|nr:hypothetical protein B0H63DRAFT_31300 [Podospora didyma]
MPPLKGSTFVPDMSLRLPAQQPGSGAGASPLSELGPQYITTASEPRLAAHNRSRFQGFNSSTDRRRTTGRQPTYVPSLAMAVPPPRMRSIAPLAPQMPRRQSCDRCHEQKVRCFTDPKDTMYTPRSSVDSEASLGGQQASSFPCVRCKKAGAMCIYSPQLRSGRPRLPRDPSTVPPRKRARRTSRSSCASSRSPTLPLSPSPPLTGMPFPSSNMPLGNLEHPSQHARDYVGSQMTPLLSPATIATHGDHRNTHPLEQQPHPIPDQWLLSPYGTEGVGFSSSMGQLSPYSQTTSAPTIPYFAPTAPTVAASTTENLLAEFPSWMYSDPVESYPEELSEINLRIHRAARALPPLANSLPSLSSPSINEVFDSACSLITLVGRYASTRSSPIQKPAEGPPTGIHPHSATERSISGNFGQTPKALSPAVHSAMDTSICLVAFACYQGLLGVFEDICASFLHYSEELQHPPSPRTPSAATFASSSTTQVVVMVNLISHLLNQLDRAINSLAGSSAPPQPMRVDQAGLPMTALSPTSSWSGKSETGEDAPNAHFGDYELSNSHFNQHGGRPEHRQKATATIFDQMEQRQHTVRTQIKTIKRMIRQSNVI